MAKEFLSAVTLPAGSTGVTASASDNSTKLATTAYVDSAVSGASGGVAWTTVNANTSMTANSAYNVTGARDMTLPASVAAGAQFIVHAFDAQVRVVSNGNIISGVGSGNDLTLRAGETAHLVGTSTGNLELV